MLRQVFQNAFSKTFIKICRPFNSREVTVAPRPPEREREYYNYDQVGPRGMSLHTENFLRGNLLQRKLEKNPQKILDAINSFYDISGDHIYLLIAADVCRYFFSKSEEASEKIRYALSSYRYCYLAASAQKREYADSSRIENKACLFQELQLLNEAIAGIFSHLKSQNLLDSDSFSVLGLDGTEFVFEKPVFHLSVPREAVADFSLCSSYLVHALRLINRHSGIGVPLVARINSELSSSLRTPPGLTIPVTLFLRVKVRSPKKISLIPCYQDTSLSEELELLEEVAGQGVWSLARDFSTPLACFMGDIKQRNLLAGMLHPVKYNSSSGLYMVEPYSPEKIPVVFVHGLMSSPETWGQMINSLKYDPMIRRKYQFWFFSYSTGLPVLFAARMLRRELQKARGEFCTTPEATRNFEQMVLVGHSMGGLLVRVLLQQEPGHMLEKLSGRSREECRQMLDEEEFRSFGDILWPEPLPFVKRAVFMAVPHRGSAVAQRKIAVLGIRLIRLPSEILNLRECFARFMKKLMPGQKIPWRMDSFITGIDNLTPDSLFVRWSADSPLKEGVIYHSIIGNRQEAGFPGGSDGIVPYESSHLDGVASECIVKSNHSVHRSPSAIRELLRILLLHLHADEKESAAVRYGSRS